MIPAGYIVLAASSGPDSAENLIALRDNVNPAYQGLRHIPGHGQNYPLIESFFQRSIGVGTRHRGGAVVVQIKANGEYEVPEIVL